MASSTVLAAASGNQQQIDNELMRIRRADAYHVLDRPNVKTIVSDCERANKVAEDMRVVHEEESANFNKAVKELIKKFTEDAENVVLQSRANLRQRMDADSLRRLGVVIDFSSKPFDKKALSENLVGCEHEICIKGSTVLDSAVDVAAGFMFENIISNISDIWDKVENALKGIEEPAASPSPVPARRPPTNFVGAARPTTSPNRPVAMGARGAPQNMPPRAVPRPMPKPAGPPPVAKRVPPVPSGSPSNSIKDKSALVAGLLGKNMMLSGIKTSTAPARKEADEDKEMRAMMQMEKERKAAAPPVKKRDVKPKKTGDSILSDATTHEETGPALNHATKDRPKIPGRVGKGKGGRRPPTRPNRGPVKPIETTFA